MKNIIDDRAILLGEFIVENNATVRQAAGRFNISKSTVHKDVTKQNGFYYLKLTIDKQNSSKW